MEKEKISRFDLEAAFKALDEIDIPKVRGIRPNRMDLKEAVVRADRTSALIEDYYDLNDPEDIQDASDDRAAEIAKAKLARIEKIVDLDAESEDEIQPSYVGKTIIQCPQCMTLFYKDPADIEPSEDDPSIVNVAEICQHCGNDSGYTLIGKVAEETPEEAAAEAPTEEPAESEEESSEETPEEEPAEENTEESSEEELNLEPIEIPEEEPEEKEEKKESFNRPTGHALNEYYTLLSERVVKAIIKEYIKPENQELVLNEINRVKTAWDNLTQDEKEDWYNSDGTIGFFFDGPDAVKWDDDVFNSDVDEDEKYEIYQDYFINYACPTDEDETNESLNTSELQKDSAKNSELASENTSKNLTLNEGIFSNTPTEWDVFEYFLKEWTDCEVDRSDLEDAFKKGLNDEDLGNYLSTFYVGDEADYIDSIYKAGKNISKNGLAAEIQDIKDCYESLNEGIISDKILDHIASMGIKAASGADKEKALKLIQDQLNRANVEYTAEDVLNVMNEFHTTLFGAIKRLTEYDSQNESLNEGIFGAKAPKLEAPANAPYTPQELFNALKKRYKLRDFEIELAGNSGYDIHFDTPKMHYQIGVRFKTEKTLDKAIAFITKECRESLNNSKLQKDSAKNSELATKNASENSTLNERVSTYAKRPVYKYKVYGTDNNANVLEEVEGEFKVDEVKKIKADMKAVMDKNPAVEHVFAEKIDENGKEIPLDHLTISRHGIDYYALDDEDVDEAFDEDAVEPDAAEVEEGLGSAVTGVVDGIASGIKSLFASNEAEKEDNKTPIVEAESNFGTLSKTDIDKLFNSKEFKTPISASETDAYLAQESLNSKKAQYYEDLEFDEKSFNKAITEALNTKDSFEATSCYISPDGKKIIVEGFVTNNTTCVSKKTTFKFKFYDKQKVFYGLNENFKHLCTLKVRLAGDNLLTESFK